MAIQNHIKHGYRVTTTDGTTTTLHTLATATGTRYLVVAHVTWRRTGGSSGSDGDGGSVIVATAAKNVGGTLTVGMQSELFSQTDGLWSTPVEITGSGTNIVVQVTGASSTNVTWFLSRLEITAVDS
jgi:hypothetical protein